jgi:hypothetical protein
MDAANQTKKQNHKVKKYISSVSCGISDIMAVHYLHAIATLEDIQNNPFQNPCTSKSLTSSPTKAPSRIQNKDKQQ